MSFHCFSPFSFENKTKPTFFVWPFLVKLYMIVALRKVEVFDNIHAFSP